MALGQILAEIPSRVMLEVGLGLSSFVAVGRVMAGRHFPTDVVVSAPIATVRLPRFPLPPFRMADIVAMNHHGSTGCRVDG